MKPWLMFLYFGILITTSIAQDAPGGPALSFEDGDSRVEMDNQVIRLVIDKNSGAILEIHYKGDNLVGEGKGYMQSSHDNGFFSPKQKRKR